MGRAEADPPMPKLLFRAGTAAILLLFFLQGVAFVRANSQTSDEAVHLVAGYSYLAESDFRLNPEHPALLKQIAALPLFLAGQVAFDPDPALWERADQWRLGLDFLYRSGVDGQTLLSWGRVPMLLCGVLLVALVGWWSQRIWGPWAGLLGMTLASLEPNLVAHASLVTTDLGFALFVFASLYLLWEYGSAPSIGLLVALGVSTGAALASKYSAAALPAILLLVAVLDRLLGTRVRNASDSQPASRAHALLRWLGACLLVAGVASVVVAFVYRFEAAPTWLRGLRQVLAHGAQGHDAFFLGQYSEGGWWSYFLVAFLIKTPLGSLALIAASLLFARAGVPLERREAIFLLVPVICLFAIATLGGIDIGLRHVLPVYPFLFVAAARLATLRFRRRFVAPLLVGVPLALTAVSSLRVAPHQLAYFNEAVGGPAEGHRYLSDSNLDWGQGLVGLREYMQRERLPMIYLAYFGNPPPSAYGIRYQHLPAWGSFDAPPRDVMATDAPREILAISVMALQGIRFRDRDLYGWLRQRQPIGTIGYSIRLYDVTGDAEAHLRLAEVYLKAGPRRLAIPELRKVLRLDPDNPQALRLLSRTHQR